MLKLNKIKSALTKSIHPTISKLRLLASQQQLLRIDNEEDFSEDDWESSLSKFKKHISAEKNKVLIISDYGKGTLKNIPSLISEAKKYNKIVLVDPKGNDFSRYIIKSTMNLKMLSKGNVLVVGDIILDKYISGIVDRVSPEAPVPVLKPQKEEIRLGGAANVALNLSSLGLSLIHI